MIKEQFPIFAANSNDKPFIYLDSAASTHKPRSVIEQMGNFYAKEYATINRGLYEKGLSASNKIEGVREKVASFIGAMGKEIVFTSSVTMSINMVALSFCESFLSSGDEIILSKMEHHSNYLPWVEIAKKKKLRVSFVKFTSEGIIDLDDLKSTINSKTKLVVCSHVSNVFGSVNPIKDISAIAKSVGAKVFIDGAQAIAHEKVDVKDLGVDFYAFSAHKMYGPTGVGILYGTYDLLEKMEPCFYGGSMIETIEEDKNIYREAPYKFEAGTIMLGSIVGLQAAIEFIESVGLSTINAIEYDLSCLVYDEIKDFVSFLSKDCRGSSILSFTMNMHPSDIAILLSSENICVRTGNMCCQPLCQKLKIDAFIRVSFAAYNTKEDALAFIESIKALAMQKTP